MEADQTAAPTAPAGNGQLATLGEEQAHALPQPRRTRWQPLRLGLVDVFYYDHEEMWFRDGRLLLRGNNGTGKSKVLALTMPFLLDGEVAPHRVEPDGDPGKRMEWNLLLDGAYTDRTGYVWLELGRLDDEGRAETLTLGCGLKAVAGKGAPQRWFFATGQRVGVDLWLVTEGRTAKTKDRLAESLDDSGRMVEQPGAWRRLVDEQLFGLGPDRYESLLRLLIQLRQPQLSRRPDEAALSAALTEALAPPDQDLVHDVAQAFRSLEAERTDLDALKEARDEAADFADRYAAMAAIAARRAARTVTEANSAYERLSSERSGAERDRLAAAESEQAAAGEVAEADEAIAAARAEQQALRDSETMRDARALEREDELATAAERRADDAEDHAAGAAADRDDAAEALAQAERAAADAQAAHEAADREATEAAEAAGLARDHRQAMTDHVDDDAAARRAAEDGVRRRREQLAHVGRLAETADARDREAGEARRRRDETGAQRDAAAEAEQAAAGAVTTAAEELTAAVRAWCADLVELPVEGETLEADVAVWADSADGDSPLTLAVRDAERAAAAAFERDDAALAARDAALADQRAELAAERAELAAGHAPAPPVPHTRDDDARTGRAGAPLWHLIDFADHVDAGERAGLEAALEAGGLLDAWVTPDGSLLAADTLDVVLTAGEPADRSAGEALVPSAVGPDGGAPPVASDIVAGVLAGIGLGAGSAPTWVDAGGGYRVGPLEGRWRKDAAEFVGHAAREAARRRRLAELDAQLEAIDADRGDVADQRARLSARREGLHAEVGAAPDPRPVVDAHVQLAERTAARARLDEQVAARDADVTAAEQAADQARAARDEAAADLAVPVEAAAREALRRAVDEYAAALRGLVPLRAAHRDATARRDREHQRHERLAAVAARRVDEAAAARREAIEARTRVDTLRAQVGAAVAELTAQLEAIAQRLTELDAQRQAAEARQREHHDTVTRLAERVAGLDAQLAAAAETRNEAVASFQRFAATGLVEAAAGDVEVPDPAGEPWAADPAVRLARRVNAALDDVDDGDQAWDQADKRLVERFTQLADVLSIHDYRATLDRVAGAPVVEIVTRTERLSPRTLADRLGADIAERERLLTSRERELFETHLIDQVGEHLGERISVAETQLAEINEQLASRPTSTGMTLKLDWSPGPDAPEGLAAARQRLLRQRVEAWGEEARAAVGGFLQDQIAAVRAAREGGRWEEHLAEALDYRQWHVFTVQRKTPAGWRRATGPASGGERALAMTVPMLAAAASFYRTAGREDAPRPIMLDEVFAGIDDDARAKCLGLLAEFDLDVIATSEREWGCYPTVPGLAIAQLARAEGIDAVHVTRWEWDGQALQTAAHDPPPLTEPAGNGEATLAHGS